MSVEGVIAANSSISEAQITSALLGVLRDAIRCSAEVDGYRVDTPYVLSDGALLQVMLLPMPEDGPLVVTDAGYAAAQAEIFAGSAAALRERYSQMARIARELDLEWTGEFRFTASDLDDAARGLSVIARAVDRALALNQPRPRQAREAGKQAHVGKAPVFQPR